MLVNAYLLSAVYSTAVPKVRFVFRTNSDATSVISGMMPTDIWEMSWLADEERREEEICK